MTVKQQFHKTQLCAFHKEGRCPLTAPLCAFAHDQSELRRAPDLTRTKLCPDNSRCRNSSGCQFAHSTDELRSTHLYFKSKLCKFHAKHGQCSLADKCRFAHGQEQLRGPSDAPQTAELSPQSAIGRADTSTLVFTPNGWGCPQLLELNPAEILDSDEPYDD